MFRLRVCVLINKRSFEPGMCLDLDILIRSSVGFFFCKTTNMKIERKKLHHISMRILF